MAKISGQAGKELDLPVYFGDAGSSAVLHSLGAHHAACAVITLDTPGEPWEKILHIRCIATIASAIMHLLLVRIYSNCSRDIQQLHVLVCMGFLL